MADSQAVEDTTNPFRGMTLNLGGAGSLFGGAAGGASGGLFGGGGSTGGGLFGGAGAGNGTSLFSGSTGGGLFGSAPNGTVETQHEEAGDAEEEEGEAAQGEGEDTEELPNEPEEGEEQIQKFRCKIFKWGPEEQTWVDGTCGDLIVLKRAEPYRVRCLFMAVPPTGTPKANFKITPPMSARITIVGEDKHIRWTVSNQAQGSDSVFEVHSVKFATRDLCEDFRDFVKSVYPNAEAEEAAAADDAANTASPKASPKASVAGSPQQSTKTASPKASPKAKASPKSSPKSKATPKTPSPKSTAKASPKAATNASPKAAPEEHQSDTSNPFAGVSLFASNGVPGTSGSAFSGPAQGGLFAKAASSSGASSGGGLFSSLSMTGGATGGGGLFSSSFTTGATSGMTTGSIFGQFGGASGAAAAETQEGGQNEDNELVPEEEVHVIPGWMPSMTLNVQDNIPTGEEDETAIFTHRAKLLRWRDGEWKERGLGDAKLLKHKETGVVRFLLRQERTEKAVANFLLVNQAPYCQLSYNSGNQKILVWSCLDCSDEEVGQVHEKFALQFKFVDTAAEFQRVWEEVLQELASGVAPTPAKAAAPAPTSAPAASKNSAPAPAPAPTPAPAPAPAAAVPKPAPTSPPAAATEQPKAAAPTPEPATTGGLFSNNGATSGGLFSTPVSGGLFSSGGGGGGGGLFSSGGGLFGGSTGGGGLFSNITDTSAGTSGSTLGGSLFAGLSAPATSGSSGGNPFIGPSSISTSSPFALFGGGGVPPEGPTSIGFRGAEKEDDNELVPEEEVEVIPGWTPEITLQVQDHVATGEEDEDMIWSHRAKILRWRDGEWKERGKGDAKLLKHKTTKKVRFLMRQERTEKAVANFLLVNEGPYCQLVPNAGNVKIQTWSCLDCADEEVGQVYEQFALKFGTQEAAEGFVAAFNAAKMGTTPAQPTASGAAASSAAPSASAAAPSAAAKASAPAGGFFGTPNISTPQEDTTTQSAPMTFAQLAAQQNAGKWRCDACRLQYSDEVVECATCEIPRPGYEEQAAAAAQSRAQGASDAAAAFLGSGSGAPKAATPAPSSGGGGLFGGSPASGGAFSFGAPTPNATPPPVNTAGCLFGSPASSIPPIFGGTQTFFGTAAAPLDAPRVSLFGDLAANAAAAGIVYPPPPPPAAGAAASNPTPAAAPSPPPPPPAATPAPAAAAKSPVTVPPRFPGATTPQAAPAPAPMAAAPSNSDLQQQVTDSIREALSSWAGSRAHPASISQPAMTQASSASLDRVLALEDEASRLRQDRSRHSEEISALVADVSALKKQWAKQEARETRREADSEAGITVAEAFKAAQKALRLAELAKEETEEVKSALASFKNHARAEREADRAQLAALEAALKALESRVAAAEMRTPVVPMGQPGMSSGSLGGRLEVFSNARSRLTQGEHGMGRY